MADLNRRDFVAATAGSVALVVLGSQQILAHPAEDAKTTVNIGKPADYAAGAFSDKFAKSDKVLVARVGDRIYALTAVCPHRKGTLGVKDGEFRCPRHGSLFSADGKVIKGPAKVPLVRHGIALDGSGNLIVDKSRTFEEDKWNDPAAYYTVKTA
jgi:nitrite reductase/ring-hydroxylating ferredoxin subunit